jgi:hypothetical protein
MSDKDYLWSELTRKNPRLLDNPHFTPSRMRKFFDRVYDAGWNAGYKSSQTAPQAALTSSPTSSEQHDDHHVPQPTTTAWRLEGHG